ILKTLVDSHPRILINDSILAQVKQRIDAKPDVARWYDHLKTEADELLQTPPSHYEIPDGRRLLSVSRRVKERIRLLGLLYHVDGDRKYADRALDEAFAACAFPDWNPAHFLDTAEMTYAIGMAYDWFYALLDSEQRETLVTSIVEMGLKPGLDNSDPKHVAAVSKVLASGKKHGVAGGILVDSPEAVNERIAEGFKFIGLSSDEGFMRSAASAAVSKINRDRKIT
ncbi:MAG: hypothetical protein IIB13_07085, partial [Chloroflexi bacterium]|nr:hypothetical protein [Chloroflexota bacterium]